MPLAACPFSFPAGQGIIQLLGTCGTERRDEGAEAKYS